VSILVTGGAGYIGSHVVRLLNLRGDDVVVLDDLSTGHAAKIGDVPLVRLDLSSHDAVDVLRQSIAQHGVDAVIHVAAQKQVGQSMERPLLYMRQNVGGMINLLDAMETSGVRRLVFSSSAATYGAPNVMEIDELTECVPINTYGETKLIGERMCERSAGAWGLAAASLRYFNVAGAGWPDLGDPAALNLIPIVFDRLVSGHRPQVFGDDYPTPDGSCIRDYVHVLDLAEAHVLALDRLAAPGHQVLNIGTGRGSSVFEVLDEVGRATGLDISPEVVERRPGDPARLIGKVDRAAAELGWQATRELPAIVASAWEAHPRRAGDVS
jgi:UDP-glucose 4-epimerase